MSRNARDIPARQEDVLGVTAAVEALGVTAGTLATEATAATLATEATAATLATEATAATIAAGVAALAPSREFSGSAVTALTAAAAVVELAGAHAAPAVFDGRATDLPDGCRLGFLNLQLDTIAGAGWATMWLAHDENGDHAISSPRTVQIVPGATDATNGGASISLDGLPYQRPDIGLPGRVYAVISLNAGTANGLARLFWEA